MNSAHEKVRFAVKQLYKRLDIRESADLKDTSGIAILMSREMAMNYKRDHGHDLRYSPEDRELTSRVQDLFTTQIVYFGQFADISLYQVHDPSLLQPVIVKDGKFVPLFPIL